MAKRELKKWWLLDDKGLPMQAEGQSCAPDNPDIWWFPAQRYSTGAVYATKAAALAVAIRLMQDDLDKAQGRLATLTAMARKEASRG